MSLYISSPEFPNYSEKQIQLLALTLCHIQQIRSIQLWKHGAKIIENLYTKLDNNGIELKTLWQKETLIYSPFATMFSEDTCCSVCMWKRIKSDYQVCV